MDTLLEHWPFILTALVFGGVGQAVKQTLWTKANAKKHTICWWGRKTMPAHPVVLGVLLGLVPGMPASPGVETTAAVALYYAGAGMFSTWGFALLKGFAKKRGYDLKMPGEESAK